MIPSSELLTQYERNPLPQHERAWGRKLHLFLCFLKAELIGNDCVLSISIRRKGGNGYFGKLSRISCTGTEPQLRKGWFETWKIPLRRLKMAFYNTTSHFQIKQHFDTTTESLDVCMKHGCVLVSLSVCVCFCVSVCTDAGKIYFLFNFPVS